MGFYSRKEKESLKTIKIFDILFFFGFFNPNISSSLLKRCGFSLYFSTNILTKKIKHNKMNISFMICKNIQGIDIFILNSFSFVFFIVFQSHFYHLFISLFLFQNCFLCIIHYSINFFTTFNAFRIFTNHVGGTFFTKYMKTRNLDWIFQILITVFTFLLRFKTI